MKMFTLFDANAFEGVLGNACACDNVAWSGFHFMADAAHTARVSRLKIQDLPVVSAETGGKLEIERPLGIGLFQTGRSAANHRGEITFLQTPGPLADLQVVYGTVTVHGAAYDVPALAPGAWLHLDAQQERTIETDGQNVVTRWSSANASGVSADAAASAPAYLRRSFDGARNVVDFGAWGPHGAYLDLSQTAGVCEMFVVFRDVSPTGSAPSFGCGETDVFARGQTPDGGNTISQSAPLFATTPDTLPVQTGDVRLDGQCVMHDHADSCSTRLRVLSVALDAPVALSRLCAGKDAAGGLYLAEILLYTNRLSLAQRRTTHAALMAKWLPAGENEDWDFGRVMLTSRSSTFHVGSGTVRVRAFSPYADATHLVKTGAGTLTIDRTSRPQLPIEVHEGAVTFRNAREAVAARVARDPDMWFDAAATNSMTLLPSNDCLYVTRWDDVRNGTNMYGRYVHAQRSTVKGYPEASGAYATLRLKEQNDLPAVDFGDYYSVSGGQPWGWVSGASGSCAPYVIHYQKTPDAQYMRYVTREAFAVVRRTHALAPVFSGGNDNTVRNDGNKLFGVYAGTSVLGGYVTVNGLPVQAPAEVTLDTENWYVVSLRATDPVMISGMAASVFTYCGGIRYGELITYDRLLTDAERRGTLAYLLGKWRPDLPRDPLCDQTASVVPSMVFAPGVTPVLGASDDLHIARLDAQSASLRKTGSGDVVVGDATLATFTNLSHVTVSGGSLTLPAFDVGTLMAQAKLHLDASDDASFTYSEKGDIAAWRDLRNNGWRAVSLAGVSASRITPADFADNAPVRVTFNEGGVAKKVVDFKARCSDKGGGTGSYYPAPAGEGAALGFVNSSSDTPSWDPWRLYNNAKKVYEVYVVMADRDTAHTAHIVDTCVSDASFFARGATGVLCTTAANKRRDACVTLDGAYVDPAQTAVTDQALHVYSVAFTNHPYFSGVGMNRTAGYSWEYGGKYVAEMLYFDTLHTPQEREEITRHLMKKWKQADAVRTHGWQTLALAADAALVLSGQDAVAVGHFTGNGRVQAHKVTVGQCLDMGEKAGDVGALSVTGAADLTGVGAFVYDIAASTRYDSFAVSGKLALPGQARLTLRFAPGARAKDVCGRYFLMKGAELEDVLAGWTLDVQNLPAGVSVRLCVVPGALVADVTPSGTLMLLR